MVVGKPYIHWKITDEANLTNIDPTYLWGTIIESDKGPIDTPVFITQASQAKRIFNYNLDPFFANGGRYVVVVRAYGVGANGFIPRKSEFDFTLDADFKYAYVDYEYYNDGDETPKATVKVVASTVDTLHPKIAKPTDDDVAELNVTFSNGRWRECTDAGVIKYYYEKTVNNATTYPEAIYVDEDEAYYDKIEYENANGITTELTAISKVYTKEFNESEVNKTLTVSEFVAETGDAVIHVESNYEGDFEIPITVALDVRQGYRVSIKESNDYTIMLSGATNLDYITTRINERAQNVTAELTAKGEAIKNVLLGNTILGPKDTNASTASIDKYIPLEAADGTSNKSKYIEFLNDDTLMPEKPPVGTVFSFVNEDGDVDKFSFKLAETQTYMANGSNGPWDEQASRVPSKYVVAAHEEALSHLANIKLSGVFCMYGEDEIQKLYIDHVSTTEPQGMNSTEVCKWRELIIGANNNDRTPDDQLGRIFNLYDKAIACDNEYIMYLAQGLVDTGYTPEAKADVKLEVPNQLLPYQSVQYVAGLRSGLFYGDSIFGGEAKKQIRGVGNLSIAPLLKGENKVFWQPDIYTELNEYGCLTFTEEYGQISLTDGVTTRQSPLEQDEEGVVSIKKYAQHAVHETLQKYIGRNITGDLQTGMEVEVRSVLNNMYTIDKTLIDLPDEGLSAFDVEIIMVPKSDANQILSKVYVYLKITPVHALRQIEVELTVQ